MAKKFKGEIELENGMVMVMDFNTLIDFEDQTGKNAFEEIEKMDEGSVSLSLLRQFYFACLKRHQPNLTIDEAGDVLSDYPEALGQVLLAASPDATDEDKIGNTSKKKTVTKTQK